MGTITIQQAETNSVLAWLESQNEKQAHCAKQIIESRSFANVRMHLAEITDWLAAKAQTSKDAGKAYCMVTEMAANA